MEIRNSEKQYNNSSKRKMKETRKGLECVLCLFFFHFVFLINAVCRTVNTKQLEMKRRRRWKKEKNKKSWCIFYNHAPFPLNSLKRLFFVFTVHSNCEISMKSACFNSFMQQIFFIYSSPALNTKLIGWKKKFFFRKVLFFVRPSSSYRHSFTVYFFPFS